MCNFESKDQDDIVMAEFSESRKRFTHVSEQKIDERWQTMTVKLNFRSLETSSPEPEADSTKSCSSSDSSGADSNVPKTPPAMTSMSEIGYPTGDEDSIWCSVQFEMLKYYFVTQQVIFHKLN